MKPILLSLLVSCILSIAHSQSYWQQEVNYLLDVKLNDREKTLDGFGKLTYKNNSPDTLDFIWFHLWPNAYRTDRTAFSDQLLKNGNINFYFSKKEEKGYINRLDFKVDGITSKTEDHPQHIDIVKLILPKRLAPGQQVTITTPFHVKLPYNVSRSGYDGESFQVTQWYPKPAVYDSKGWHPMPYLDQGEFYSEFGNFDVRITLPKNYVVGASGELQNAEEKEWLRSLAPREVKEQQKGKKTPAAVTQRTGKQPPPSSAELKTINYKLERAHDFAWFANKEFIVGHDTCALLSGKIIDVYSYYTPGHANMWKNSVWFAKQAVRFYSAEVGEYPYSVVSVVQGPKSFGGGMEYPTITVISPTSSEKELDLTIAHEVGHNWFYGILASNERDYPWMDEGINTFYTNKYALARHGDSSRMTELLFQTKAVRRTDQPVNISSERFGQYNYGLVAYHKAGEWMRILEQKTGSAEFRNMMQDYYRQWKFRHPQPQDFKQVVSTKLGSETDEYFSLLDKKGILPGNKLSGSMVVSPFIKKSMDNYTLRPTRHSTLVGPAIGVNHYDKLMVGALITNYKPPPTPFQFLLIPMYAIGSKDFTGLGRISYSRHSEGRIRKTDFFLNASAFAMDDFKDTAGRRLIMHFKKVVPGFRLTLREKDPTSSVYRFMQWKTFLINEESLRITSDTVGSNVVLRYNLPKENRYVNQFRFVFSNYRALYPFDVQLQVEQGQDFIRPALTANYFFNYGKTGGLGVRFFAGKFMYLGGKTLIKQFRTDRYHLNLTGPNGAEDYTYSDYFVGRNEFEGFASQQIMNRDGAFKVRTDLLASKVGKTDDWLMALNFNSTIPQKINPLSVLPVKIPLRIFADIGTYAEAWKRDSNQDRFVFDAGLHIPLFRETVNIYLPLVYSSIFSNYIKSTIPKSRLTKTMSFSINLFNKDLEKLNKEVEF